MKIGEAIMLQDFRIYHKLMKRKLFNTILTKSTKNPFPNGKYPSYVYWKQLEAIFKELGSELYKKVWITDTCHPTVSAKYKYKNQDVYVQTGVTFTQALTHVRDTNKRCKLHYARILNCYNVARECIAFAQTSGHMDLAVKCNIRHKYYLEQVFDRFGLNRKCIELDETEEIPKMVIIMDGDTP